jgi:hypothetical protein
LREDGGAAALCSAHVDRARRATTGGPPVNRRELPAPARPFAAAVSAAVSAAADRDAGAFADAVAGLAALDPSRVGLVLGTLVRVLLEDGHPDGLDAGDVRAVLERSVRSSAQWQPDVDPQVMLLLLAGALGVYDPDDGQPPPPPGAVARHGALLVAELVGKRSLADCLTWTFAEIERAQLND